MTKWEAEKDGQNNYLRMQLAALRAGPKARWRKFRLLVVFCGRCGDALVEVIDLEPYPVILTRKTTGHPSTPVLPADASVDVRVEHLKHRLEPIRLDKNWLFVPISRPAVSPPPSGEAAPSDGSRSLLYCACRCRSLSIDEETIIDDLRAGRTKRVVPAPEGDELAEPRRSEYRSA